MRRVVALGQLAAVLLAACGGSSAAQPQATPTGATSSSVAPAPGSLPLRGTPAEAAAAYFALFNDEGAAGRAAASTEAEAQRAAASVETIARARLVDVQRVDRAEPGVRTLQVLVYIEPPDAQPSPWGEPGEHVLFMTLVRANGGWLVDGWGTGP